MTDGYFDERAALEQLYTLIRQTYKDQEAQEIAASFDRALAACTREADRRQIIEHWRDFYRLQEYRRRHRRRRPKPTERVLPCSACGYPASHRHHLWEFAAHGENEVTIRLCPNCHEINHLLYNTLVRESDYSRTIVLHIVESRQVSAEALSRILAWCLAVIRYEADQGWIDGQKGSREAVEARLRWSEYLRTAQS